MIQCYGDVVGIFEGECYVYVFCYFYGIELVEDDVSMIMCGELLGYVDLKMMQIYDLMSIRCKMQIVDVSGLMGKIKMLVFELLKWF